MTGLKPIRPRRPARPQAPVGHASHPRKCSVPPSTPQARAVLPTDSQAPQQTISARRSPSIAPVPEKDSSCRRWRGRCRAANPVNDRLARPWARPALQLHRGRDAYGRPGAHDDGAFRRPQPPPTPAGADAAPLSSADSAAPTAGDSLPLPVCSAPASVSDSIDRGYANPDSTCEDFAASAESDSAFGLA